MLDHGQGGTRQRSHADDLDGPASAFLGLALEMNDRGSGSARGGVRTAHD